MQGIAVWLGLSRVPRRVLWHGSWLLRRALMCTPRQEQWLRAALLGGQGPSPRRIITFLSMTRRILATAQGLQRPRPAHTMDNASLNC